MLGDFEVENGRILCPSHDTIKYYMEYVGRGKYVCTGDQFVPVGRNGMKVTQPCSTEYYIHEQDNAELTKAVYDLRVSRKRWRTLFWVMTAVTVILVVSNAIPTLKFFGLLP